MRFSLFSQQKSSSQTQQLNLGQQILIQLANSTQYNNYKEPVINKSDIVSSDLKRKLYDILVPLENLGLIQTTKDQIIYVGPPFSCFDYIDSNSINYNFQGKNSQLLMENYKQNTVITNTDQNNTIQIQLETIRQIQQQNQQLAKQIEQMQMKQQKRILNYNEIVHGCQLIIGKQINNKMLIKQFNQPYQNIIYQKPDILILDKLNLNNIKIYEPLPIAINGNIPNIQLTKQYVISATKTGSEKLQTQLSPIQQSSTIITMNTTENSGTGLGITPFLDQLRNLE